MRYFLILYIVITFLLGLWQTSRFNYKSNMIKQMLLPAEEFTGFQGNEFKAVFLKGLAIRDIFRFYVGNKNYKLITVTSLMGNTILLDLGLCENCDFDHVKKKLSKVKKLDIKGFIIPINRYNSMRKLLFKNDYVNNLCFYYDVEQMTKLSHIEENSISIADKYIIYNTESIDDSIKVNDIQVFNPHLWYLIFWYSLSIFGIVSFYIRLRKN